MVFTKEIWYLQHGIELGCWSVYSLVSLLQMYETRVTSQNRNQVVVSIIFRFVLLEAFCVFWKEQCYGDLYFYESKLPQIKTKQLCETRNVYKKPRGRYQVNFRREENHNQSLSKFSKTQGGQCFKIQSISILAICSPRHSFLLLEHYLNNFKQNWTLIFGCPLI